ncbi:Imm50 family immunity protein [Hymenobacter sp. H14-R3]|nr:Imm50 family immunity protein [Hymenobacter sp. H14-R3]MDJ0366612.1 Imm50 family immunity protein [Hymenobacter sp. H14-R3]
MFQHFGYWPDFHDAEVMKVTFEALPTLRSAVTFTINAFEMTNKVTEKGYFKLTKRCQIEIQLTGIKKLNFNYFSFQNVLFELWLEKQGSDIKAVFSSSVGMEAAIVAEEALILSLVPVNNLQVNDIGGNGARGSAQPL